MRRIGAELDVVGGGAILRSIVLDENYLVQEWRNFEAPNPAAVVSDWLESVKPSSSDICRLAVSVPGQLSTGVDLQGTRLLLQDANKEDFVKAAITNFADQVMDATRMELAVAASVGGVDRRAGGIPLFLCGTPRSELRPVWEAIGNANVDVAPVPMLPQADGAYLIIRDLMAQLYLIQDGIPFYIKDLRNSGLASLYDLVGGRARLQEVLSAGRLSPTDPLIPIFSGFIQQLTNEVSSVISQWMSYEFALSRLWVAGPGATLPGLLENISNHIGIQCLPAVPPPEVPPAGLPVTETPAAWMAIVAASADLKPLALLNHEGKQVRRQKMANNRARALSLGGRALIVLAIVLAILLPIGWGLFKEHQASSNLSSAEQQFSAVASDYHVYSLVTKEKQLISQIRQQHPNWAAQAQSVLSTVPPGAAVTAFSVTGTPGAVNMNLSITVPSATPFSAFATWLQALQGLKPKSVQVGQFTFAKGAENLAVALSFNAAPTTTVGTSTAKG